MSDQNAAVCFTCGQPSGDVLRLNTMPSGQVCPTCRDRLLEGIPAALPGDESGAEDHGSPSDALADEGEEEDPLGLSASKGPGRLLMGGGPIEPA